MRDRIAAALGTTDPDAIVAAVRDYVGTYAHVEEYVADRITELLPPGFGWVVHCCDPSELRRRYEAEVMELWTIPAEGGGVMVFASRRTRTDARSVDA
ncbi:MAG TPA: hypothetical protein VIK91_02985 [Nannocystis sp.]